jgi:hypothetical protein
MGRDRARGKGLRMGGESQPPGGAGSRSLQAGHGGAAMVAEVRNQVVKPRAVLTPDSGEHGAGEGGGVGGLSCCQDDVTLQLDFQNAFNSVGKPCSRRLLVERHSSSRSPPGRSRLTGSSSSRGRPLRRPPSPPSGGSARVIPGAPFSSP